MSLFDDVVLEGYIQSEGQLTALSPDDPKGLLMLIDLLLPPFYALIGWLGGYCMFCRPSVGQSTTVLSGDRSIEDRELELTQAMDRLRQFSRTLAADVNAHQSEVQAVNHSLQGSGSDLSGDVVYLAVNRLIEANESMQRQLQTAQDQIQDQASQLQTAEMRAHTDALTRTGNRRAFDSHLTSRFELGPASAGTVALIDIDRFKQFNDVHGHLAGDEVLRAVAGVLQAKLGEYGLVARYGGEEFGVIFDAMRVEECLSLVEAARHDLAACEVEIDHKRLHVTVSVGLAELMPDQSIEQWLQRADEGLYRSKDAGRNCGHWFDGESFHRIPKREAATSSAQASDRSKAGNTDHPSAYLPDREMLRKSLDEIIPHVRQANLPLAVLSIRLPVTMTSNDCRAAIQTLRHQSRSLDRIGFDNPSNFVVYMPNTDSVTAIAKARNLYHEFTRDASTSKSTRPVGFGVAMWGKDDDWESVLNQAHELAREAFEDVTDPVRIASPVKACR